MWSGAENENGISIVNIFRAKAFKNEAKIVLSNYADDRKRKETVKDIRVFNIPFIKHIDIQCHEETTFNKQVFAM